LQLKQAGEYFLPDILGSPDRYIRGWNQLESSIKTKHTRSVVQAGGHIGIFPAKLSAMFKRVYTFEPEYQNFQCLVRNASAKNVFPQRAALGAANGGRRMDVQPRNTGGHQLSHDPGEIPMLRIDDLGLTDCDAFVLDLEGFEFFALLGATQTIMRCRPLIIIEENKKSRGQGFQPGAVALLLNSLDYRVRANVGENIIFEAI
jgi:FkbM family methyltransferase